MAVQIMRPAHAVQSQDRGFLASLVARVGNTVSEYRRFQRTRNELETLTDRELADIGLNRAEIENVAWRCARPRG